MDERKEGHSTTARIVLAKSVARQNYNSHNTRGQLVSFCKARRFVWLQ